MKLVCLWKMHYLSYIVPLHTNSSVKVLPISIAAVTNI